MRFPAILTGLLAAAALSACSSTSGAGQLLDSRPNAGPCPSAGSVYGNERIVEFGGDGSEVYSNISYTGEIVDVQVFCRYVADSPLRAEVEIDFALGKGAMADTDAHDYTYFVAVTRRNRRILSKERFNVRADFKGKQVIGLRELIGDINIPRNDEGISGANFEILVGFELTEAQQTFNREGRRFRLDAGN